MEQGHTKDEDIRLKLTDEEQVLADKVALSYMNHLFTINLDYQDDHSGLMSENAYRFTYDFIETRRMFTFNGGHVIL